MALLSFLKTLFLPALLSLILYLLSTHLLLPLYRRHRHRYAHYLPLPLPGRRPNPGISWAEPTSTSAGPGTDGLPTTQGPTNRLTRLASHLLILLPSRFRNPTHHTRSSFSSSSSGSACSFDPGEPLTSIVTTTTTTTTADGDDDGSGSNRRREALERRSGVWEGAWAVRERDDERRRLSRELEEGFRDESDDDDGIDSRLVGRRGGAGERV